MRKLQRWVTTHQTFLLTVIYLFFLTIAICFSGMLSLPVLPTILIVPPLVILVILISAAPIAVMKEPAQALQNDCDPYPLLQETEALLSYKLSRQIRPIMLINYSTGLRNAGQYQAALDTMLSIKIDKRNSLSPVNMILYYLNLTDICIQMQRYDEAVVWYEKLLKTYNDLPENNVKKQMASLLLPAQAEQHLQSGQPSLALAILDSYRPTCRSMEVDVARIYAKAYLALEKPEFARENLQLVIEKGNKLYAVTEAKELLAKLDAE